MHISRPLCRCCRLLYSFSTHETEMTHSAFVEKMTGRGRRDKGWEGGEEKKREQKWILLLAMAEFRRSLERRTHSNVNNKMAAFHQHLFYSEKKEKKKKVMRHMSKSALAASLLMWQKMSWGWMIDNVNATLCIFKCDSSACLFYFYLCF